MIPKRRSRENHLQLDAASKAYGGFVLELNLAHACCSERRAEGSSGCASQPGYTTLRGRQYAPNPFPGSGYSAAQPFRRGAAWTSSASHRELGRLRHLMELVPTTRRADRGNVSRAESRGTCGRQLPAHPPHSSSIVDHRAYQYHRVARYSSPCGESCQRYSRLTLGYSRTMLPKHYKP